MLDTRMHKTVKACEAGEERKDRQWNGKTTEKNSKQMPAKPIFRATLCRGGREKWTTMKTMLG